jgi:alpha-mannosidase
MHRWVDMSEADFGVALLNDCKYAYDAHDQTIRLTLVRGSNFPSADADLGEHRLRYALFVHDGLADLAEVHRAAERFNNPIAVIGSTEPSAGTSSQGSNFSFVQVDQANVTIETVKKAEKSGAVILRVFEHANIRANATLYFGVPVKSVRAVNLMEEGEGRSFELHNNSIELSLHPFEIKTLLIEL